MNILKAYKSESGSLYLCVDEIPEITYEIIGRDYIGSDENGCFSHYLKKQIYSDAFGGREISLKMKDGSIKTIKDYWFDYGSYPNHGEFVKIGIATIKELKECYVYCSKNINKSKLEELIEEYLKEDTFHDYYEIKDWIKKEG